MMMRVLECDRFTSVCQMYAVGLNPKDCKTSKVLSQLGYFVLFQIQQNANLKISQIDYYIRFLKWLLNKARMIKSKSTIK